LALQHVQPDIKSHCSDSTRKIHQLWILPFIVALVSQDCTRNCNKSRHWHTGAARLQNVSVPQTQHPPSYTDLRSTTPQRRKKAGSLQESSHCMELHIRQSLYWPSNDQLMPQSITNSL